MTTLRTLAAVLCAMALTGCEKNAVQDLTGTLPNARIRFFNFGLNAPAVNFYAGDRKVTAITSASGVEAVTGVAYGGVGSGGFYAGLEPASYTFSGRIAAAIDKDLPVATATAVLTDGKAYSFYMSGLYDATAKRSDSFVVEDDFSSTIDFTRAYVRFVNGIFNAAPMALFARDPTAAAEIPIAAAVAYKAAGAFVAIPGGVYDISTRVVGGTTNVISRLAVSFSAGRVYTITSRGDITIVSTTLANRPILDNTANR